MQSINLATVLTFVLATTFTPGPNNISSASMGIMHGYRNTRKFLLGITSGFFVVMLLCSLISKTLLDVFPSFEAVLRLAGAAYIMHLAYASLRMSYDFDVEKRPTLGFGRGLLLQIMNPKAIVYGLTLYTSFLVPIAGNILYLIASAAFLAVVAFAATSTWALSGSAIRQYLTNPTLRRTINIGLALVLAYTALELSGLLSLLFTAP